MATPMPSSAHPSHYSIRHASCVLAVSKSELCRAIRRGAVRTVRRRSALVIPASELVCLLGGDAR